MKKEKVFPRLMHYAGKHKVLTYLSLILSAISGVFAIMPFVYIYFINMNLHSVGDLRLF